MLLNSRPQTSDDRQRVLDATDIVRLIGDHLALKPKGREYVALCPFHDDHAPSMFVVPAKQIYKCFSCGAGGNAIDFVVNYHKMSFREALEHLAERAGITLTPRTLWRAGGTIGETGEDTSEGDTRAAVLSANATAQSFFRAVLNHPEHGRSAREMIQRRQISPEMVEEFQLGASPNKWDGLVLTLASRASGGQGGGHSGSEIASMLRAGLLKSRDNGSGGAGGVYDAFRDRLMFPIHDQIGRSIAFGARRLNDEDEPKYLNSSESPVFNKSATLYALHQAAQGIRTSRIAIVTEGYMDAIACHQAGVRNAVATLGTALTPGNARVLRRLADTVVLLFDGDQAGQKAAERAVEVFFAEPVDVRIATLSSMTDAKDPDELLKREGGVELLKQVIERAIDPMELLFARVRSSMDGRGLSARGRVVDEFVAKLVDLGLDRVDKVRYQLIIKRLAEITGVDWNSIASMVVDRQSRQSRQRRAIDSDPGTTATASPSSLPVTSGPREHLLGCILCVPQLALTLHEDDWQIIDPVAYCDPHIRAVAQTIAELIASEMEPSLSVTLAHIDDAEARRVATHLAMDIERLTAGSDETIKAHWRSRLELIRSQDSTASRPTSDAQSTPAGIAANIESIRKSRATLGHDRRTMPRPSA